MLFRLGKQKAAGLERLWFVCLVLHLLERSLHRAVYALLPALSAYILRNHGAVVFGRDRCSAPAAWTLWRVVEIRQSFNPLRHSLLVAGR